LGEFQPLGRKNQVRKNRGSDAGGRGGVHKTVIKSYKVEGAKPKGSGGRTKYHPHEGGKRFRLHKKREEGKREGKKVRGGGRSLGQVHRGKAHPTERHGA